MDKVYSRIIWQNQPSTATALGATNLNKMDVALNTIDDRVVAMDTSKANQSTMNGVVQSITYNDATGVLTITKVNGTSATIDTKLEKLAVNFSYNSTTQKLVITLDDGTTQEVDLSSLITQYEFSNTDTIAFTLESGVIKANIINGSITPDKLNPSYLAELNLAIENANTAAENADIATDAAIKATANTNTAIANANSAAELVASALSDYNATEYDLDGGGALDQMEYIDANGGGAVITY